MAADDDPLSGLSPEERAYLRPGKPQQGAPAAPASTTAAPATAAPSGTSTSTATPPPGGYSIFNPDPSGVQHAIETGFGQGFRTVLNAPADWINRATGWQPYRFTMPLTAEEQQGQQAHPVAAGIGRFGGEALAGAPAALVGGEVLPAIGITNPLIAGAAQGAAQNALTSAGSPDQSIGSQMLTGAGFGAAGGAIGSRIGRMFGSDAALASQAVQDAGNTAKAAGIEVLPGNLPQAGATAAQKGAAASPGQIQQVNRAFGNIVQPSTGQPAAAAIDDFSAKNLGPLKNSVGNEVSTAVNQGQIQMTRQLASDLQDVVQNARQPGIDPLVRAKIENEVGKVLQIAPNSGDVITGSQYDRLVGANSKLSGFMGDKQSKDLSDLAHQLDTALDNGFQASSPPGVYDQWVDAKTRYRLLNALEDNVEGDASGNIKPGTIMADINRRFPNMPTQTGQSTVGQASDLARAVTTLFGGGQGAPGAAAAGGWISQHPLLAMAGAGGAAGVAGPLYNAITNPAAIGSALTWGAGHIPTAGVGLGVLGTDLLLRRLGAAYQRTPAFANALLRRGTQAGANPYGAYLGAAAAALPPDRGRQPSP